MTDSSKGKTLHQNGSEKNLTLGKIANIRMDCTTVYCIIVCKSREFEE